MIYDKAVIVKKMRKVRWIVALQIMAFTFSPLPSHSNADEWEAKEFRSDIYSAQWNPKEETTSSRQPNSKVIRSLNQFKQMDELDIYFKKAVGYAVYPSIGKVGFGIGGATGKGELFKYGVVIGSTRVSQISLGLQLGGQKFSQIIFFATEDDLEDFTDGNFEFNASASAVLINEGAATETEFSDGVAIMTISKGGLMYEASIGGQKFNYSPY